MNVVAASWDFIALHGRRPLDSISERTGDATAGLIDLQRTGAPPVIHRASKNTHFSAAEAR